MQIELRDIDPPGYLLFTCQGAGTLASFRVLVDRISVEVAARGRRRVLADVRSMSGALPDMDRFEIGVYAAEKLTGVERFAVLASVEHRINRFFEDTARNRGLQVRVFLDEAEALAWTNAA